MIEYCDWQPSIILRCSLHLAQIFKLHAGPEFIKLALLTYMISHPVFCKLCVRSGQFSFKISKREFHRDSVRLRALELIRRHELTGKLSTYISSVGLGGT